MSEQVLIPAPDEAADPGADPNGVAEVLTGPDSGALVPIPTGALLLPPVFLLRPCALLQPAQPVRT